MSSLKSKTSNAGNKSFKDQGLVSQIDELQRLTDAEGEVDQILKQLKDNLTKLSVNELDKARKKSKEAKKNFEKNIAEIKKKLDLQSKSSRIPELMPSEKFTKKGRCNHRNKSLHEVKKPPDENTTTSRSRSMSHKIERVTSRSASPTTRPIADKMSSNIKSTVMPAKPVWHVDRASNMTVNHINEKKGQLTKLASQSMPPNKIKLHSHGPLAKLQDIVNEAIRDRKTFTVVEGYYNVRKALISRGWVEKFWLTGRDSSKLRQLNSLSMYELLKGINDKQIGSMCQRVIMSKMLANHQVDFFWSYSTDIWKMVSEKHKLVITNRIKRGVFNYASKGGLCESLKRIHWFLRPGISCMRHPRAYLLSINQDPKEFIDDFKITAAASLLKWVIYTGSSKSTKLISKSGKIPVSVFYFAVNECTKYIKKARHEDIDLEIEEAMELEWQRFLEFFYKTVHVSNHFKSNDSDTADRMVQEASSVLENMDKYYPYMEMDGYMNIWILKPGNGCRGVGIHICRTLQYVLQVLKDHKKVHYVVQKYIEKPLLIYNTKFDIRQWFLISNTVPLTVWIYRDCYLRFSSQTYNLRKLHESIHLTNNAVQCRYRNAFRDEALPSCNMWDVDQFKAYLSDIGQADVFDTIIFPGMKQCITSAILVNQDHIEGKKHSFELYGADFLLTEDFKPWLLEINSRPALYSSTPVTAKMCQQVLEDLIKVVIDHPKNPRASTGLFKLLYKHHIPKLPQVDAASLQLEGKPLPKDYFNNVPDKIDDATKDIKNSCHTVLDVSKDMKKTLERLLCLVQRERDKRSENIEANSESVHVIRDIKSETILGPNKSTSTDFYSLMESSYSEGSLTEYDKSGLVYSEAVQSSNYLLNVSVGTPEIRTFDKAIICKTKEKETQESRDDLVGVMASILQMAMDTVPNKNV